MTIVRTPHVSIPVHGGRLEGDLALLDGADGIVVFVHGSGSSRTSPRNRHVAGVLAAAGMSTLLVDLFTSDEAEIDARAGRMRFDIELLTARVLHILGWVREDRDLATLDVGLLGSSTGAAAALTAAARAPQLVDAVVSRGGRPDLVAPRTLGLVRAPTLLIVGERDREVLDRNRDAATHLNCEHELATVPEATHLFSEPGTLDRAARLAADWFTRHLGRASIAPGRPGAPHRTPTGWTGPYPDRVAAGETLARWVAGERDRLHDPIVLALPRGGVDVAIPVARALGAPLDVIVARKVGVPFQRELALGAVDEDGVATINQELRHDMRIGDVELTRAVHRARREAQARAAQLRRHRPPPDVDRRDVILVDDGYATGMTAVSAGEYLHRHGARMVLLAVPVAPRELIDRPPRTFDAVVCPYTPEPFRAVGLHYRRFDQVPDEQVMRAIDEYTRELVHVHEAPGGEPRGD